MKTYPVIVALLIFGKSSLALAGPPLSIDDPGVLDAWHWEIIGATTLTSSGDGDYWQAPVLDVSLGIIEHYVQVGFVYPYAHADSADGGTQSDFGNAEFGVKWRFFRNERLQMAFAPYHAFGVSTRTADKGIGDDRDATVLPINAEYRLDDRWTLNGEVRYVSVDNASNEWGYGAAVAYAPDDRWILLVEVAGASDTGFDNDFLELRAGFDMTVTDSLHLLFSIATGIEAPSGAGKLDYDIFLGLQFFP
jgi:hypothetical protein